MLKVLGSALAAALVATPAMATTYVQDVTGSLVYPDTISGESQTATLSLTTGDTLEINVSFANPIVLSRYPATSALGINMNNPLGENIPYFIIATSTPSVYFTSFYYKGNIKVLIGDVSYSASFNFDDIPGSENVLINSATLELNILDASVFPANPIQLGEGKLYFNIVAAPELSTWLMMLIGAGFFGFASFNRRRERTKVLPA